MNKLVKNFHIVGIGFALVYFGFVLAIGLVCEFNWLIISGMVASVLAIGMAAYNLVINAKYKEEE